MTKEELEEAWPLHYAPCVGTEGVVDGAWSIGVGDGVSSDEENSGVEG